MKKTIYATIALFIAIMIWTAVVANRTPIREVKYENGEVVTKTK
jgi:hypothetical protein